MADSGCIGLMSAVGGRRSVVSCLVSACLLFAAGCMTIKDNVMHDTEPITGAVQTPETAATAAAMDLEKLVRLWETRAQEKGSNDYPVGPGDVVEISVPAIEELRTSLVRISGDGSVSLPFVGKMQVAGLTEDELRQKVLERLKQYMYKPRVLVFVREYRSRQVAVLGAVTRPGLYSLTSGADTLLDVISQAGGITPGADPKIYFIPAEPVEKAQGIEIASTLPKDFLQQDPTPLILKRTEPILIDIKEVAFGGTQKYLSLAVRPGDIIMVPGGGHVLVEGWVEKPGAYNFSPGLTLTGAIAQAGGQLFPADLNSVKVIRANKAGMKTFIVADLERIKHGGSVDIALQGGDIVEVSAQTSKLIPYGLYRFFSTVINVGVGGSVPIVK